MLLKAQNIPYQLTNSFSPIVLDYLHGTEGLKPFYSLEPSLAGIEGAIEQKKKQPVNRPLLVEVLKDQYASVELHEQVKTNIEHLASDNTFSVCTAHQPNLFTGPLYFLYKIIHAIKLSEHLKSQLPKYNFVPVYYMGCEDADFDELNHTHVNGKRIEWLSKQTGAVGRMVIDDAAVSLINEFEEQLSFQPFGGEVVDMLKRCYTKGKMVQQATFEFVNELFGSYGLIVLIPDDARLKKEMIPVFEDDILHQTPSAIVGKTSAQLESLYNVQASPREINLFYLKDNIRERIIKKEDRYLINNTSLSFSKDDIKKELREHSERFSPNVILRGLFQETILPNIAFIGGGGELAYWLQLKSLFEHYKTVFPVLILRNSFLVIEDEWKKRVDKLSISTEDLFKSSFELLDLLIERYGKKPHLNGELDKVEEIYKKLNDLASSVDATLSQHVDALKVRTLKQLDNLEKKMMRAERKKQETVRLQIEKLKNKLFPKGGLQERVENFSSFYAKWGRSFIQELHLHSLALEQQFVVLEEAVQTP